MTIEVRQLMINASVGSPVQRSESEGMPEPMREEGPEDELYQRLRDQLMTDLKSWLEDRLSRMRER